jgi:hypothetical protein
MLKLRLMAGVVSVVLGLVQAGGQCLRAVDSPGQEVPGPANTKVSQHWDPDGAGPLASVFVVGGAFEVAGTSICRNICYWDGSAWQPLGQGLNGQVDALTVFNGDLIAAGQFTASGATVCSRVARWNTATQQWVPLGAGAGGVNGAVHSLALHSGRLYVGGEFTSAGGLPAAGIASWSGTAWAGLGSGLAGSGSPSLPHARCMASFGGELYVGGYFQTAGGLSSSGFAKWNGTNWIALGVDGGEVRCIRSWSHHFLPQTRLYVGGQFTSIAGTPNAKLATFSGSAWSSIALPIEAYGVYGLSIGATASGADVYAMISGPTTQGVYRYVAGAWSLLAPGGSSSFNFYAGQLVACWGAVQRWDGAVWRPFGDGIQGSLNDSAMYNGSLYLGGSFSFADQQQISSLVRWDGSAYSMVGTGVTGSVNSLVVHNNALIAGGYLTNAGGVAVSGVARWNGSAWSAMAGSPPYVTKLLVHNGQLYLAGYQSNGTGGVYRWNGFGWTRLGQDIRDYPRNLFVKDGVLYTSGRITTPTSDHELLKFDGVNWVSLGGHYWPFVAAPTHDGVLAITNGYGDIAIHVCDTATSVWTTLLPYAVGYSTGVYDFEGQTYASLPGGLFRRVPPADWEQVLPNNGGVTSMRRYGDDVVVTGSFTLVDDHVRASWVILRPCCGSADFDRDGDIGTDADIEAFFACLAGACCPGCTSDFNYDGDIGTDSDIEAFFRVLAGGSC